jgi:NAD(P)-dependent dehydrogenase (short-subunit alcohol dehydrogenase family)
MMGGLLLSLKNEIVKTAPRGRVNCVAPGWVRTPMADRAMADPTLLYQALASYVYRGPARISPPYSARLSPNFPPLRAWAGRRCAKCPSPST